MSYYLIVEPQEVTLVSNRSPIEDTLTVADTLARYATIDPTLTVSELVTLMPPATRTMLQDYYRRQSLRDERGRDESHG